MNLLEKKNALDLEIQKKELNIDNLIYKYKYKPEGINPNNFRNHQNTIELFKNLRDGNINPKELLKY